MNPSVTEGFIIFMRKKNERAAVGIPVAFVGLNNDSITLALVSRPKSGQRRCGYGHEWIRGG
jgi:hypothetical protein